MGYWLYKEVYQILTSVIVKMSVMEYREKKQNTNAMRAIEDIRSFVYINENVDKGGFQCPRCSI